MAEWRVKSPADYSPNGDDIDRFAQKSIATFDDIYEKLNRLRRNGAAAGLDETDTSPFEGRIDTTTGTIYMRDATNKKWMELGAAAPFWGIQPENIGAVANGGGMERLFMGNDADKPTTGCKTHDFYFAVDTRKLYVYEGSDWHILLSRDFKDMLNYEDYVVAKSEVALKGANKILRLDPETGKGDIDITGSADHMLGKEIQTTPLHDTDVLAWSEEKQAFVNRPKDTFTEADATYTGEAGKLARVNSDGKIHANLAGNADKIAGKAIAVDSLKGGEVLAYDADLDVFVNRPKDEINPDDVTTTGEAGKIVRVGTDGKLHADLAGNAQKVGNIEVAVTDMQDGEILAYHASVNKLVNEPRGAITGAAKSFVVKNGAQVLNDYNGSKTEVLDLDAALKLASGSVTNHLDRLIGDVYLAILAAGLSPDGYDAILVENFDSGAQEIDNTVAEVTSIVSGDNSIDVADSSTLLIGGYYQLTDGENTEQVQIKSINVSETVRRVILMEPIKNQYHNGRTKLCRSTVAVHDSAAYGGGMTRYSTTTDDAAAFVGSDTRKDVSKSLSFQDVNAFIVTGAHLKDGVLVMGGGAYGVAFNAAGSTYGDWRRVNNEGDNLAQDDLSEEG